MSRRTTILGRGGTVLIAISLALFLVSFIPPQQMGNGDGITEVSARTFSPLNRAPHFFAPVTLYYDTVLTPQQGVELELTANGTITVYILEVNTQTIFNWISEQQQVPARDLNVTRLEEFLEANPNAIGWQHEINKETIKHTYIPTKVTNVTIVYSNPSSENIGVNHSYREKSFIAPGNKVLNIALWTAPIGIILAIPWLLNRWKQRKQK